MKKTNLLIFTLSTSLMLTACFGGKSKDKGTKVDLTTEEGKAVLKDRANLVVKAYDKEFTGYGFETEVKNVALTAKGSFVTVDYNENQLNGNLDASLTNFGFKVNGGIVKDGEDVKGQLSLKDLGFDLSAKGSIPVDSETNFKLDNSLSVKKVGVDVYLADSNVYVDYSSKENKTAIDNVSKVVNKVLEANGINMSLDLNTMLDSATGVSARKIAIQDAVEIPTEIFTPMAEAEFEEIDDETINQVAEYFNQFDFLSFVTFKDGRFGVELNADKEDLVNVVNLLAGDSGAMVTTLINQMVTKFDLSAGVYFTKAGLLDSTKLSFDFGATARNLQFSEDFTLTSLDATFKGEMATSFLYDSKVKVSLPSSSELAKYVVINEAR